MSVHSVKGRTLRRCLRKKRTLFRRSSHVMMFLIVKLYYHARNPWRTQFQSEHKHGIVFVEPILHTQWTTSIFT